MTDSKQTPPRDSGGNQDAADEAERQTMADEPTASAAEAGEGEASEGEASEGDASQAGEGEAAGNDAETAAEGEAAANDAETAAEGEAAANDAETAADDDADADADADAAADADAESRPTAAPGELPDARALRDDARPRIAIANPSDGGVLFWTFKLFGFAGLVLCALGALTGLLVYRYFANLAPPLPDLAAYAHEAPGVTRMYAADGTLLGEFAEEWREVVPYESIPEPLVHAFLAVEDHEFFSHNGLYFKGILRALWANFVAGDFAQGGSTITQQVAKQFLGNEKSLSRKAKEAILARRLEARYSKRAILSLYMNHIYLGAGAYGVAAAARRYFSKKLDELTIAEMATIAGLARAPSYYSPLINPEHARERRDLVLDRMATHGFLPREQAETWQAEPLVVNPYETVFPDHMPYFAEHVRRDVEKRYGKGELMKGGLVIETTVDPVVQGAAEENVDYGVRKQDKRQGWRGPEWFVEGKARETFVDRAEQLYGDAPLEHDRRYLGLVEEVNGRRAIVRVGAASYELPLRNMDWASRWEIRPAINDELIESVARALKVGDVIWVSREPASRGKYREFGMPDGYNPVWLGARESLVREGEPVRLVLEQVPHPQGAIFTADHQTGYVLAIVGGYDHARNEYNRAIQALRQPGSTYKPIYYSAALDSGYGFDTLLNDIPIAEVDPETGEVWTPTNLGGTVDDRVTLEYALVFSKNVPSVAVFKHVGADSVEKWARRLGFTSPIIADKALALGASSTYLHELTRAFAIFARNGEWIEWAWIRRITDRAGNVIEDHTVAHDPHLAPADRLDRLILTAGDQPRQAIPARAAYLTSVLLRQAMKWGFASIVRRTGIIAAGKTGTSSATMDTSFVGYTSRWITAVWLGDDKRVRPLGRDDAAYMTVVPMWARYMYETFSGYPQQEIPWEVPEGVRPRDRGEHKVGERGDQMNLIYRKHSKPATDDEAAEPAG